MSMPEQKQPEERKDLKVFIDQLLQEQKISLLSTLKSEARGIRMGEIAISGARWRKEALKSYGNAIVPQIAEILFRNIKICQEQK